jgi:hypothetical protein
VWDDKLNESAGHLFLTAIEKQLKAADKVIVVWSERSKVRGWVLDEASHGASRGALIPVRIDDGALPLGFGQIQTLDFRGWDGDTASKSWLSLLESIERSGSGPDGDFSEAPVAIVRPVMISTAVCGLLSGVLLWVAYRGVTSTGILGSPFLSALSFGFGASALVSLSSGLEMRRFGYVNTGLLVRQVARSASLGVVVALVASVVRLLAGAPPQPDDLMRELVSWTILWTVAVAVLRLFRQGVQQLR